MRRLPICGPGKQNKHNELPRMCYTSGGNCILLSRREGEGVGFLIFKQLFQFLPQLFYGLFRHRVCLHICQEQPVEIRLPFYDESKPFITKTPFVSFW